jgi:hypothetical protein
MVNKFSDTKKSTCPNCKSENFDKISKETIKKKEYSYILEDYYNSPFDSCNPLGLPDLLAYYTRSYYNNYYSEVKGIKYTYQWTCKCKECSRIFYIKEIEFKQNQ